MKDLFLTTITKPPEVIVNKFSVSVSVSFFLFSCSKGQAVRACYLDTIQMTLVSVFMEPLDHLTTSLKYLSLLLIFSYLLSIKVHTDR